MLTKNVNNFKSGDRSILKGMSVFVFFFKQQYNFAKLGKVPIIQSVLL